MTVSPALTYKARKNEVERRGMVNAHIKDAVALIDFLSFMEEEVLQNKKVFMLFIKKKQLLMNVG